MFIETVEIFPFFVYFIPCGQKGHEKQNYRKNKRVQAKVARKV